MGGSIVQKQGRALAPVPSNYAIAPPLYTYVPLLEYPPTEIPTFFSSLKYPTPAFGVLYVTMNDISCGSQLLP